ncbi:trace amine-associated receptor 9-like [Amphiura filiformis]|uniref:trace amine-associated receptor 9-like n=1 Tax=Amphiura filiformis TaxID=82378 RepID=UPI003B22111F
MVTTPYINRVIRSCCMTIVSLLIVFGNAFCLLVLRRTNNIGLRDTTKIFLISLTCADLSLGIFGAIPVTISAGLGYFPDTYISTPVSFCTLHASAVHSLSLISCLSLFVVTVERYISVVSPLRYPLIVTVRRTKIVVIFLWTFICMFFFVGIIVPYITVLQYIFPLSLRYMDPDYLICFPSLSERQDSNITQGFFWITVICGFTPILNVVFMYTRMLHIARRRIINTSKRKTSSNEIADVIAKRQLASERRAVLTFLIITTASIVAWLPFTAVVFVELILLYIAEPYWKFLSILFLFSGSWFNVVIYYIRNKRFRTTAKQILSSIL